MTPYFADPHFEAFIHEQVASGRYASADEVILTGLKLVEAQEKKLAALRQEIQEAIAEDEWYSFEEVLNYAENKEIMSSSSA